MSRQLARGVLAGMLLAGWAVAESRPPGTDDEIRARLQPFGTSCMEGDTTCGGIPAAVASGAARSGQEVYDTFCFACHATGLTGAPLFQDEAQWAPRLEKGMDALVESSMAGINAMPPMGTCMACSEEEMAAAIRYASGSE